MRPRASIRLPARSVARTARALRALLCGLLLSCLLGGDCHWAFSSNTSGNDHHDDGGTTVIVTDLTMGDGVDPALFELGECLIEFAGPEAIAAYRAAGGTAPEPVFQRAVPLPPGLAIAGVSPTRIWPPERIGEPELAAFAQGLLSANEEVLHLPVGVAALQYLDTEVVDGVASVRFGAGSGAPIAPALAVRFGSGGELIAIEMLPATGEAGDRIAAAR
jgi:hypothetical protein